jgi:hypothetical protein
LRTLPAGIVKPHGKLSANDFLLFDVFVLGERRIHHRIGKDRHRLRGTIGRNVDPVDRPIKACIGINVAAAILNLSRDVSRFAILCALEEHVLEDMRQTRTHPFAFVNASGGTPRLHTRDRRRVIFFDNQGETIIK